MDLKGFGLENFRVFKDYQWFDFAPITLLIGPNNSGKSSLIKALLLLKESIDESHGNISFNFKSQLHNLSGWEGVINDPEKGVITFDYSTCFEESRNAFLEALGGNVTLLMKIGHKIQKEFAKGIITRKNFHGSCSYNKYFLGKTLKTLNPVAVCSDSGLYPYVFICPIHLSDAIKIIINEVEENLEDYILKEEDIENTFSERQKINILKNKLERKALMEAIDAFRSFTVFLDSRDNYLIIDPKEDAEFLKIHNELKGSEEYYDASLTCLEYIFKDIKDEMNDKMFDTIIKIINDCINEHRVTYNQIPRNFHYLPATKGKQKRIFQKDDVDFLSKIAGNKNYSYEDFITKWGEKFGISDIIVGRDEVFDFNFIKVNERALPDLGYGISQLVTLISSIAEDGIKILEEPESNLHPKFQSLIADMLVESIYYKKDVQYIIETHSEYIVRKFQYLVAKGELKKKDIVIYYFNDPNNIPKGEKQIKKIEILDDGSLSDDFGAGFFDEAAKWELELLKIKRDKSRNN